MTWNIWIRCVVGQTLSSILIPIKNYLTRTDSGHNWDYLLPINMWQKCGSARMEKRTSHLTFQLFRSIVLKWKQYLTTKTLSRKGHPTNLTVRTWGKPQAWQQLHWRSHFSNFSGWTRNKDTPMQSKRFS